MEIKLDSSKLGFKVNYQKIFQNLFDFNLGSAATEILSIDANKESSAFALLFNVTHQTNILLVKELDQEAINRADNLVIVYHEIESELLLYLNEKVSLNKDFFENIIQFNPDYLVKAYHLFKKYLDLLKIKIPTDFHYKYYLTYRTILLQEYNNLNEKYKKLSDFFENPILEANESFAKQMANYIEIGSNYTGKLQSGVEDSNETLQDLYVAPYFKIYNKNLETEDHNEFITPQDRIDVNLFLNNFILKNSLPGNLRDSYNMIFILGQPGQGKTSLCYKLIFDILEMSNGLPKEPLFFIKIRDLHAKDFVNDTFNTLKKAIQQNINFDNDKCVIVLDGLDEAYMSGGLTDTDLKNLYERLNKTSRQNKNLKIILTSRLNYLNINDPSVEGSLIVKIDVLENNQIKEYLRNFKKFYPENILVKKVDQILDNFRYNHIEELLQQPVLMYFIALSNIDIEESDSKAKIYNKIFDSLAKRSWDKNGQLNHIKAELQSDHKKYSKYLRQYIRNLAFEIYQSPYLHITVNKLISLDSTREFMKKCFNESILSDKEAIKDVSKYLLVSFYFQASNKSQNGDDDGDAAIEFFHNSLWEYLTAEYMWEENKRIILSLDDDDDFLPVRIDEYFDVLKKLIGNKHFKEEVRKNLENIISIESIELRKNMFKQTKDIFFKLIDKEMLLTYDWKTEKLNAKDKMQGIFEIAWTFFYRTIIDTDLRIETNTELNDFLFHYRSNFNYGYDLKNINFEGTYFNVQYVSECNVENVNFNFDLAIESLNLSTSKFKNTEFKNYYQIESIHNNSFTDVTFYKVNFLSASKIVENNFKNVKIIDAYIPDENWLENIITNNTVDEDFIKKHKVIKKTNFNDSNEEIFNYHITYTEDADLD